MTVWRDAIALRYLRRDSRGQRAGIRGQRQKEGQEEELSVAS